MNKIKSLFTVLATVTLFLSCNAEGTSSTEYKTLNESAKKGFTIKANLANTANHLVVLQEWSTKGFTFLDSARTDENSDVIFSGSVEEGVVCYMQFGQQQGVLLFIENGNNLDLAIDANNGILSYTIKGKKDDIKASQEIKETYNLNNQYYQQMLLLEQQAKKANQGQMMLIRSQYAKLNEMRTAAIINHMKEMEPSPAHYLAYNMIQEPPFDMLKLAVDKLKEYNESSKYYVELKKVFDTKKANEIGYPAQEININSITMDSMVLGDPISLHSLKGKVVLIDFWASWCGPCRRFIPENIALYDSFKSQGFEVYAVSLDNNINAWFKAINKYGMEWINVSELKGWGGSANKKYGIHGIPATLLLDKEGNIAAKNLHGEHLKDKVKELLQE